MDYDSVITPGAKCINCEWHKQVTNTAVGVLVHCGFFHEILENDQAEHCNYYSEITSNHEEHKK